ncbi:MAG: ABC transporter ATP-binding protein [Chloroflexi bacterium]|nr:ABC transporter ATP-binding protein [Chloroflexota bacterium]
MTAFLETNEIHTYYGTSHVLFGISLKVQPGEVVALLGRNGVGKTTTIHSIMGVTPPREGSIIFKGEEIARLRPYQIARRGVALVPAGRRIFPTLTVRENLEIARKPAAPGREPWTVEQIYDLFPRLKERDTYRGSSLSGGEQQMLAVGRALMGNPEFLLLDEPAEGLAPLIVEHLRDMLLTLKSTGLTMLLCEQNIAFATAVSDRGYVLDKGTVKYQGTVQELKTSPEVRSYLAI